MHELQSARIENFPEILRKFLREDPKDITDIYSKLRALFTPKQIAELIIQTTDQPELLESDANGRVIRRILAKAEAEIPFDEAYNRDLMVEGIAPFYDRVGDAALHMTFALAFIEFLGVFIRKIEFSSPVANQVKSLIFDYIGDSQASFIIIPVFALVKLGEKTIADQKIRLPDILVLKKAIEILVETGKILLPYIMISIMLAYQIDVETVKILPGSFGTPDIRDIPVGLISIIGLAKVLEIQKYHRSFSKPFADVMSKIQARIHVLNLISYTLLGLPGLAEKMMKSRVLQEKVPPRHSPLSFVRSASKKADILTVL